jgi:hypothetical protein
MGLRSPVSANPTTSEEAMVFDKVSVMPTDKSSKYKIRSTSWFIYLASLSDLLLPRKARWESIWETSSLGAGQALGARAWLQGNSSPAHRSRAASGLAPSLSR